MKGHSRAFAFFVLIACSYFAMISSIKFSTSQTQISDVTYPKQRTLVPEFPELKRIADGYFRRPVNQLADEA